MKLKAKVKKNKLKLFDESNRKIDCFKLNENNYSKELLEGLSLKYGISKPKKKKTSKKE